MTTIISKAGYAAAAWSAAYAAAGAAWALGAPGFPWGASDPDPDGALSILAGLTPDPGGWWVAAFGLLGAITALALVRGGPAVQRVAVFAAWPLALLLAVVIPDSRLMMGVAYTPLMTVAGLFDGPWGQIGLGDAWPWPVLNQLLCMLGGVLLAGAALTAQRARREACGSCGRADEDTGWTTPASAARWGRVAVMVAVVTPLIYCATRWAWPLGIPLGVSREFLEQGDREARHLAGRSLPGDLRRPRRRAHARAGAALGRDLPSLDPRPARQAGPSAACRHPRDPRSDHHRGRGPDLRTAGAGGAVRPRGVGCLAARVLLAPLGRGTGRRHPRLPPAQTRPLPPLPAR
ncbi:hypothetical protein ACFQGX_22605 [Nonomuraea dietziae]|uniref:hypothetical protein n=1 Tax=Nonomuraea dietziae TaxID=65515 RepID=UPI00360C0F46